MTQWLEEFRKQIEYCAYCPKLCRFACPVAQIECSETVTPTGKATVLKLVREKAIEFDREAAELFYACSACRITRTYCEHDIDVYPSLEKARSEAVKRGLAPRSVSDYQEKWAKRSNPFDEDLASVIRQRAGRRAGGQAETVLFAGCMILNYFPEQIEECVRVLDAAGADYRVFADDRLCCGYPLLALGLEKEFEAQAAHVSSVLRGAGLVLSPCPSCTDMLRNRYRDFGVEIPAEVRHITEFLSEGLLKMPIEKRETRAVIYHDPCYLGRYLGVYQPPREILEAVLGTPPLEFFESREGGTCCGGGGGLPVTRPETARGISRQKAEAMGEMGAAVLATACPTCRMMLGRAARDLNIEAVDVVTLLSRSLADG